MLTESAHPPRQFPQTPYKGIKCCSLFHLPGRVPKTHPARASVLTLFIEGNRPTVDNQLGELQGNLLPALHHLPLRELVTHTACNPRLEPLPGRRVHPHRRCSPGPSLPPASSRPHWTVNKGPLSPRPIPESYFFSALKATLALRDSWRVGSSPPPMPQ